MSDESHLDTDHQIPGTTITLTGRYALPFDAYKRRGNTDVIVVHCADTPPTMDIGAAEIRKWHVEGNGWLDIGYHWVIRRNGNIERGRPTWAVGSGVEGFNSHSIHICLVGGANKHGQAEDNFTPAQKDTLFLLINTLRGAGPYSHCKVLGHRDFPKVTKQCPSFDAPAWFAAETEKVNKPGLLGGKGLVA